MFRNQLIASALDNYINELFTILETDPADGTALLAAMDAMETGAANVRDYRYKQVLNGIKNTRVLSNGGVSTVTITAAGSGYEADTYFPIDGDGTNGSVRIVTVDGSGQILTAEISVSGKDYTTATVDLSGAGDGLATMTFTVGDNDISIIDNALSLLSV